MILIKLKTFSKGQRGMNIVVLDEFKFPNNYPFRFNIFKKKNWKMFLRDYLMKDGNEIPKYTPSGQRIYRDVSVFGGIMGTRISFIRLYSEYYEEVIKKREKSEEGK